jgi:hypothetical protein
MVLQTRLVVCQLLTWVFVILFLDFHLDLFLHVASRPIVDEELALRRVNLGKLVEIIDNLEPLGVLFRFVEFGAVLQALQVCPQHANPVEKMNSKVKIILLPQSQLVVIVVQTFFGQPDHLGCLLQTDLMQVSA